MKDYNKSRTIYKKLRILEWAWIEREKKKVKIEMEDYQLDCEQFKNIYYASMLVKQTQRDPIKIRVKWILTSCVKPKVIKLCEQL